ncbi:hypothetical protein ACFVUS_16795 [Nocardia sp. NPDC058058]|uniref:hypothetical protein n=1 Tax=Nocardia sp. NPDC058058 TaxID=3346317 RepID=UPI0036D875CD
MLEGKLVGYLWGAESGSAAGYFAHMGSGIDHVDSSIYWYDKLGESYQLGLKPVEAIRHWVGKPEDPKYGGISIGAELGEARTIQDLALRLNPDAPLGDGPWEQDGEYPSGAPVDRSKGWGPLFSTPTRTYPEDANGPVTYLPVARNGVVLGYIWASEADNAAGYVQRTSTGSEGMLAGGLWRSRFIDTFGMGLPALDAMRRNRSLPAHAPELFGVVDEAVTEQRAASLADLRRLADSD